MAPPWYPVPPQGYGGIEVVVGQLARELGRRGHRVTLFAAEGSDPGLDPIAVAPGDWGADLGTPDQRIRQAAFDVRVNRRLQGIARELDVIHLHTEFPGMAAASLSRIPVPIVATLHSGMDAKVIDFLGEVDAEMDLVAISRAQRDQAPGIRWSGVVHNAVAGDSLEFKAKKDGYLVELARITPDKGQHLAIEVAERTGMPLVLAGKVDRDAASQKYFEELIEPRLGETVRWVENVGEKERSALLGSATAMLFPIQWEEPFGLAMVEAMFCGTPVVAFNRGAAGELVDEGVTGFLVDSTEEMIDRTLRAGEIDPAKCSEVARGRFSAGRMTDGYEQAYLRAISGAATRTG